MIGWIDANAGASGDMFLGALCDAGVPLDVMQSAVDCLSVGIALEARPVMRGSLGATKVDVRVDDAHATHRHLDTIVGMLQALDEPVRSKAVDAFQRLGEAEAAVHRVAISEVHFHEVGALDALADIVGTAAGFAHLGLSRVYCSTVSLGSGSGRGAHGPLPIPAPAVLELLKGRPVAAGPAVFESTTPTGAALLSTFVTDWGPMPTMTVAKVGMGAGNRDSDAVVNALRVVVGEPVEGRRTAVQMDTNVDDLDPRLWPTVIESLMAAGASDAWITPITMKKGRPAFTLSVLCSHDRAEFVREAVFAQTSTIGLRETTVAKHALERRMSSVIVDGQQIAIKSAFNDETLVNRSVEWEDVAKVAAVTGRPAKLILADATSEANRVEHPTV